MDCPSIDSIHAVRSTSTGGGMHAQTQAIRKLEINSRNASSFGAT